MSEINENNKCVYVHKDKEGVVRYVGSGTLNRANDTYANRFRGKKYAEYVEANGKLEVEIVSEELTKLEAENLERELYDKYDESILNYNKPSSARSISKEIFEEFLYYDETSKSCLRWKVDLGQRAKTGSEAGCLHKSTGYYVVRLQGALYQSHRIVALLHNLEVNNFVIDHVDRNRANNKISNLRVVTRKENSQNLSIRSDNSSGVQGVSYDKRDNQWTATWYEEGEQRRKHFPIKNFQSSEDAFQAAVEYRQRMQDFHYTRSNNA